MRIPRDAGNAAVGMPYGGEGKLVVSLFIRLMQILLFAGKLVKTKNQRQNFDVLVTWRLLISQKKGASDFSDAPGVSQQVC